MKKLYVKIEGEFHELAGVAIGNGLRDIRKTTIDQATQKYVTVCTSQKSVKNQGIERLYFLIFKEFMINRRLEYMDEIRKSDIDDFEASLLKRMKPASVNRRFNTFKNFFAKCFEWHFIYENPCLGRKDKKEDSKVTVPWTKKDFDRFIVTCSGIQKKIFIFLWLTGCRPMELKNLKWSDIDHDQLLLTLKCGKNAEISRKFPLTPKIDKLIHSLD